MSLFRRRCDGKHHRWTHWSTHDRQFPQETTQSRTCLCGAVQRHHLRTGEVTIWTPDGIESGLLDRGVTRQVYEGLT